MQIGAKQQLILGPPGTGKTTDLMRRMEEELARGIRPQEIAFVSFTRKAVGEAVERACEKFNLKKSQLPLFQTVHGMCFAQLGCTKNSIMQKENYAALGEWLGYDLSGQTDMGDGIIISGAAPGDPFLFLDNIARTRCQTVREAWEQQGFGIDWAEQERFSLGYARYKENEGLMDFTDLLSRYTEEGAPTHAKVAYIDEAQDLSRAQWRVLEKCFAGVPEVFIAGDDDQSIYKWSGADLDTFLSLAGERRVLSQSHRLPREILKYASRIINQVHKRFDKPYAPTPDEGRVDYVNELLQVEFDPTERTLILARDKWLLAPAYDHMQRYGFTYSGRMGMKSVKAEHLQAIRAWERLRKGEMVSHDDVTAAYKFLHVGTVLERGGRTKLQNESMNEYSVESLRACYGLLATPIWHVAFEGMPIETREYYLSVLREGRKITEEPKVHINTIHSVKGGEAEHVVIISDMSKKSFESFQMDPDSEHRLAYVAATRAKKRLTIILPRTRYSYAY